MRLLLDTHVVLWWLVDDPRLADDVKESIDTEPDVFVSAATVWEIAIKQSQGKLDPGDLAERVAGSDLNDLRVEPRHALVAARLPPVHRDPFDRMLIAQAQSDGLTLVTHDAQIMKYDVSLLHV